MHNTKDKEEREDKGEKEKREEREEREKKAWIMENFQVMSSSEGAEHVRKSSTTLNNQSRPTAKNLSSFSSHTQTSLSSAHTVALNTPSLMPLCASGSFCPYLGSASGSGSGSKSGSNDRVRDKDKEKEKEREEGSRDRGYAGDSVRGNQKDRVGSSDIDRVGSSERGNRVAWGTPRTSPTDTAIINSGNNYHSMSSGGSSDVARDEEGRLTGAHTQHTHVHAQGYAQHTQGQGQGKGQGQVQVTREAILNLKSTEEDESIWTDDSNSQLVSA